MPNICALSPVRVGSVPSAQKALVAFALARTMQRDIVHGTIGTMLESTKPPKACKYCGGTNHTAFGCYLKRSARLRKESKKSMEKRLAVREQWFELNPPDKNGYWYCYLQIVPNCEKRLTKSTLQLEHVKSRARHPELKYEVKNLRPACAPCNHMKGSLNYDDELGILV